MSTGSMTSAEIRELITRALHSDVTTIAGISDGTGIAPSVVARHLSAMTKAGQVKLLRASTGATSAEYEPTAKLPRPSLLELPELRARRTSVELMKLFFSIPPCQPEVI